MHGKTTIVSVSNSIQVIVKVTVVATIAEMASLLVLA